MSALVLGVPVAGWHAPLVLTGQLDAISLVSTAAITVVYSWLFNRAGGSALVTLVAHAVQDGFTFGSLGYSPADLARAEYLYCLVVVTVAVLLVAVDRAAWRAAPACTAQPTAATRSWPTAPGDLDKPQVVGRGPISNRDRGWSMRDLGDLPRRLLQELSSFRPGAPEEPALELRFGRGQGRSGSTPS